MRDDISISRSGNVKAHGKSGHIVAAGVAAAIVFCAVTFLVVQSRNQYVYLVQHEQS